MTIQQMEYVVAVDKYRHFVKAAESCGVSQSTLSMMIKKLEEELDTVIFDRDAHPTKPTAAGEAIIAQARVVLFNLEQLREITLSEKQRSCGKIQLAMIPTVASYLLPKLIRKIRDDSPDILLHAYELQTCDLVDKLLKAEIDMAIMATPSQNYNLLEIPLYYERFELYVSPSEPLSLQDEIPSGEMPSKHLWLLAEGNCLRTQVMNFCHGCSDYTAIYEAGSIDSLVRIVDENGGYTVIPELHVPYLSETQRRNIRHLVKPDVVREISLVIRKDYVREGLLNEVASAVKSIIPEKMLDSRLKKFAISL